MKFSLYLMIFFLIFCSCGNTKDKSATLQSAGVIEKELTEEVIDTVYLVQTTDSILNSIKADSIFNILHVYRVGIESVGDEHWRFDKNNNLISFESIWEGEGYSGHENHVYKNRELIYVNDTTFGDVYSEQIERMTASDDDFTGYIRENLYDFDPETEIKSLQKHSYKLTDREDLEREENHYRESFKKIITLIQNYADSISYGDGLAEIVEIEEYPVNENYSMEEKTIIKLDSVFVEKIKMK